MRRAIVTFATLLISACSSKDEIIPSYKPPAPSATQEAQAKSFLETPDWYRHAIFYQVYVRSFQDSNGDGIGDFRGLISRLPYFKSLGVDAIWLMPIMKSPFKDSGYDIADYRVINSDYGTMQDFEALIQAAHEKGIRVIIDLVMNHTSDLHSWFTESRSSKTHAKSDWYVWSDTPSRPDIGCGTYNAQFGKEAWTFDETRKQYYFHRFYPSQPDLNYRNPVVVKEMLDIVKFWLDKGVDGFRADVVSLLVENAQSCSMTPETIDILRQLRSVLDAYPKRAMVAEPSDFRSSAAYFGNGKDMFHMAFNFSFGYFWFVPFEISDKKNIEESFNTVIKEYPNGAQDAVVIGSHDVPRAYAMSFKEDWRVRRVVEIQLMMKGTPFIYYGEELGLRPGTQSVVDGRDAARTPMPWDSTSNFGFTTGKPWIAFGEAAAETTVELEEKDPKSMLNHYKGLLALRRGRPVFSTGAVRLVNVDNKSIFAFIRDDGNEQYLILTNLSAEKQNGKSTSNDLLAGGTPVWGAATITQESPGVFTIEVPASGSLISKIK